MPCSMIRAWTFSKLIGAFLDLSIAYLILCGSMIAFFAAKFLGLFGLNLPCPCNGLFGNPNEAYCVQRFLIEHPASRISSVHSSVRSKFPYDLIYGTEENCQAKINKCISFDDRPLELEGEGSCSSVSDGRKVCDSTGQELVVSTRVARHDLKRKGIAYQRPKSGLRRRRKVASDYGTISSGASYDPCGYYLQELPQSSFNFHQLINGNNVARDDFTITKEPIQGNNNDVAENDWQDDVLQTNGMDLTVSKCMIDIEDGAALEEIGISDKEERKVIIEEEYDVNVLEQALKEEKAARAALYVELEKERNAAATAADEAMGMILRLQEEKASIEMQARQYQRMIEEKSSYDAEEMNLLKEILLRRERETYVLEKEVENYKRVIHGGKQLGKGMHEMQEEYGLKENFALESEEDPLIMLREISESIRKKENSKRANSDVMPVDYINNASSNVHHVDEGETTLVKSLHNEQHMEKQVSVEDENIQEEADDTKQDRDTHVVDVHVVGNELSSAKEISNKSTFATSSQNHSSEADLVVPSNADSNEVTRTSNISSRSPPLVSKINFSGKEEGSSLSEIDFERLKIENEVKLLRDKLNTVQEGRGKLNFSVENNEAVKVQLQLLDDIANQLKEMQLIRSPETGRTMRQGFVPSNSLKIDTMKRCRSLSSSLDKSS